jgi:hypothetical protein
MQVIRHPELAADIRDIAIHYAEVSLSNCGLMWRSRKPACDRLNHQLIHA